MIEEAKQLADDSPGRSNKIGQKGMTFDHDYIYSFPLLSSLLKRGKKKRRMNSKYRDQSHAFLLDREKKLKGSISELSDLAPIIIV